VRGFASEINAIPADIQGAVTDVEVVILSIPLPAVTSPAEQSDSVRAAHLAPYPHFSAPAPYMMPVTKRA
jgi:hypothetical protein